MAEHGVVGTGVLYGSMQFAFDAGDGLEEELAEVAKRVGGLGGGACFGQSRGDFAGGGVYFGGGGELAGKGGKLRRYLFGLKKLLLLPRVGDAGSVMTGFA